MTPSKMLEIMPRARRDLEHIFTYIATTNIQKARDFTSKLTNKIHWIAETDFTGVPRDDIAPGLRAFPFRDRCIYYRRYEDRIVILRVLHGAQDTERQSFVE